MVRVKICGVRRVEDITAAVRAGADAIGLNFVARSPRYIGGIDTALRLLGDSNPPDSLLRCGVFVNTPLEEICTAAQTLRLSVVQLHGEESPEFASDVQRAVPNAQVWKAVRISAASDLAALRNYACSGWVLDSKIEGVHGGSGKTFDWRLVKELQRSTQLILSGGLNPGNVAAAIAETAPHWVDVASGAESAPGVKDARLIQAFTQAARAACP